MGKKEGKRNIPFSLQLQQVKQKADSAIADSRLGAWGI